MPDAFALDGYAIVTSDGFIADCAGAMPDSLKYEADQAYFSAALDAADLIVHGRHSYEGHANSPRRRRFWLTRKVAALEPLKPNEWLWNPEGAPLAEAARAIGLDRGTVAVIGGTAVYDLFLPVYRAFHLSRAGRASLSAGTPVFSAVTHGATPEEVLRAAGLAPGATRTLDDANAVTVTRWERRL